MSVCAFLWRENNVLRYKERSKENNNNNRTMQPCGSEMGKGVTNVSIKKNKRKYVSLRRNKRRSFEK